jgi:glyoxylase-like metal-dependent hydrolase (beta-lactamase superfamily II)
MQITRLIDRVSGRVSYLVADEQTREAMLVDPVESQLERDLALIRDRRLKLVYVAETRPDPSGMSAAELVREATGARFVASDRGTPCADIIVRHGDVLEVGRLVVEVVEDAIEGAIEDTGVLSYRIDGCALAGEAA